MRVAGGICLYISFCALFPLPLLHSENSTGLSGDNFEWPRSENGKSREWEIIKFGFPPDSSLDHLNGTIGPQNRHSQYCITTKN